MTIAEQAAALVGPKPAGDPEAMLAHAAELQGVVADLEAQASAMLAADVPGSGGLIQRTNARGADRAKQLRDTATRLLELANEIKNHASAVQQAQADWQRRYDAQVQLLTEAAAAQGAGR